MVDDIYIKDTTVTLAYDGLEAHVRVRVSDIDTADLALRLLRMLVRDIEKRKENTERKLILNELPSVEHACYFVDYGNSNADIIGRQLDYKQLHAEDAKVLK